jgi:hypothetical protein
MHTRANRPRPEPGWRPRGCGACRSRRARAQTPTRARSHADAMVAPVLVPVLFSGEEGITATTSTPRCTCSTRGSEFCSTLSYSLSWRTPRTECTLRPSTTAWRRPCERSHDVGLAACWHGCRPGSAEQERRPPILRRSRIDAARVAIYVRTSVNDNSESGKRHHALRSRPERASAITRRLPQRSLRPRRWVAVRRAESFSPPARRRRLQLLQSASGA